MCHYLGGGLHGRQKRVKAQSESSKSVVNSVLISREMPVFPGFLEIIRVVIRNILVKSERGRCIPRSLLLFDCIQRRTIGWEDLSHFLYRGVEYIAKSRQTL